MQTTIVTISAVLLSAMSHVLAQQPAQPGLLGPSAAIRLLPSPPLSQPPMRAVEHVRLEWMSPSPKAVLFRPATVTLDWKASVPAGSTYDVALSQDGVSYDIPLADGLTESHMRWDLPDLPRTTLFLRVKAKDPEGRSFTSRPLAVHVVPRDAIIVSKANQILWAFHDGRLRQRYIVSTGRIDHDTRAGWFTVYNRDADHHSHLYDVDMPYALFFDAGQAIHSSTVVKYLGQPASHGCVRLPRNYARELFNDSAVGRPVIITDWKQDMMWLDGAPRDIAQAGIPDPTPSSHPHRSQTNKR